MPASWPVARLRAARLGMTVAFGWMLASCTPLAPYRTVEDPSANCQPGNTRDNPQSDSFGAVDPRCDRLVEEVAPKSAEGKGGYELHFVEFDDQGELFPDIGQNGVAATQMERFLARVRSNPVDTPTSIVVFVHGWKHNAQSADSNVRWFRAMLDKISIVESKTNCPRHVVGLYAAWRGDATPLPDLGKDATFWTRKKTAGRVADGQVRELLGRLRAIQDIRNARWNGLVETSRRNPDALSSSGANLACAKAIRLTIVGHSFGGLIVYNALSPSLIRDVSDLNERIRDAPSASVDPVLSREGDLIVTINPAVEAAAFVPLSRAARAARPRSYHAPVFVSITSADDDATGIAFPAARFFNTLLNKYPAGADGERTAALDTIGHDQDLIDYRLDTLSALNRDRPATPLVADPVCESLRGAPDFSTRFVAEMRRLDDFSAALRTAPDANRLETFFPRQFCIHASSPSDDVAIALAPRTGVNLNSPVWNVYTAAPVLDSHSDLLNPLLIDFLRQLYEEGTRPESDRIAAAPAADRTDR